MGKLKVNQDIANRARINLVNDYNSLVNYLEQNTETYESFMRQEYTKINIDKEDLGKKLDSLRHWIVTLACIYEENNPNFRNLADELPAIKNIYQED